MHRAFADGSGWKPLGSRCAAWSKKPSFAVNDDRSIPSSNGRLLAPLIEWIEHRWRHHT